MLEDRQAGPRSNTLRIARNGSLIFSNVSLSDEGQFKVDAILDAGGDVSAFIDLVVIATTSVVTTREDTRSTSVTTNIPTTPITPDCPSHVGIIVILFCYWHPYG
ncbi:uncharacterized protein [Apostichopus japonicus]|uniref:uncharacterized protein n=1 Tax=Stichopus japonicus TaxID=307972 RepID=UPI003AB230CE